ncbi:MAG: hypothetical protein QXT68_07585 [Halobacteria archaeon]
MVRIPRVVVSPGTPLAEDSTLGFATDLEDTMGDETALLATIYINKAPHHLELLTLEEYNNRGYITDLDVPPEKFHTVKAGKRRLIAVLTPFER